MKQTTLSQLSKTIKSHRSTLENKIDVFVQNYAFSFININVSQVQREFFILNFWGLATTIANKHLYKQDAKRILCWILRGLVTTIADMFNMYTISNKPGLTKLILNIIKRKVCKFPSFQTILSNYIAKFKPGDTLANDR